VKGYLTIQQKQESESSGDRTDYVFHLTKPLTELGNLKPQERKVLTSIFIPTNPLLLLSQALSQLQSAEKAAGHEALASFTSRVEQKAKLASDQYRAISVVAAIKLESGEDSIRSEVSRLVRQFVVIVQGEALLCNSEALAARQLVQAEVALQQRFKPRHIS